MLGKHNRPAESNGKIHVKTKFFFSFTFRVYEVFYARKTMNHILQFLDEQLRKT